MSGLTRYVLRQTLTLALAFTLVFTAAVWLVQSLRLYNELEQSPNGTDGLQRDKIEAVIATQIRLGGIKPGSTPVTYDQFVDESLWADAIKLAPGP